MSRVRYFISIAFAIALSIVVFIISKEAFTKEEIWLRILCSICAGTLIGELIFWIDGFPTRVLLFFLNICRIIFMFWISLFASGNLIFIIIGIAIMSFLWSAIGAVFTFGVVVFACLCPIFYVIHLATFPADFDYY